MLVHSRGYVGRGVAHYLRLISRFDGIVACCAGAVQGDPSVAPLGFDKFASELAKSGRTLDAIVVRFALIVLESRAAFSGSPEHRAYKVGAFELLIDNESMVGAKGDTVEMTIDPMDEANCNGDVVVAVAKGLVHAGDSTASSAVVKALVSAVVADVAGRKLRPRFHIFHAIQGFFRNAEGAHRGRGHGRGRGTVGSGAVRGGEGAGRRKPGCLGCCIFVPGLT